MLHAIAYDRPGGQDCPAAARPQPIDLSQLSQQTMGDRALEQEVLKMFAHQAGLVQMQLPKASLEDRKRLAHGFKGSALAVGAMEAGQCAARIMERPADKAEVARLVGLIDDVREFIARLTR